MPTDQPPTNQDAADAAILLLVAGKSIDATTTAIAERYHLNHDTARQLTDWALTQITLAANYDRTHELGTAITRLNDLYRRSIALQDTKTALAIQRELNRLLNLYPTEPPPTTTTHENPEVSLARDYLAPLKLGPTDLPLSELCRRAAARLTRSEHGP
jgi:hypothetical protein